MNLKEIRQWWLKTRDTWLGTIIYMILGFVIAYSVYGGLGLILSTDTPVVSVFSESMVPTLNKGDMVFVHGSDKFEVGDIIVFDSPIFNYPIIHRINSVTEGGFKTKGDNNSNVDPWTINEGNIHGKTAFSIPLLGWVKILFTDMINLIR